MSLESLLRAREQGVTGALGPKAANFFPSLQALGGQELLTHSHPYAMKNKSLTNDWVGCLEPTATFTYT